MKIRKSSRRARPWLRLQCCVTFEVPETSPPFLFDWDVPCSKPMCQCLLILLWYPWLSPSVSPRLCSWKFLSPKWRWSEWQAGIRCLHKASALRTLYSQIKVRPVRAAEVSLICYPQQEDPQAGSAASLLLVQDSEKETLFLIRDILNTLRKYFGDCFI